MLRAYDKPASNGKTSKVEIFWIVFDTYSLKFNQKTFFLGKEVHKMLHDSRYYRFWYVDEFTDKTPCNISLIKDLTGGDSIGRNEVLYGTTEKIPILGKLMIPTNKLPIFDTDSGIQRRGLAEQYINRFLDKNEYDLNKNKKGIYLKNKTLLEKYRNDEYKLALFHILLPFAIKYYKKEE